MQLIRLGSKLVLLNVTPNGAEALAEVTDPGEVDRLAGLCQQQRPGSITDTFRQVLAESASEPAASQSRGTRRTRAASSGRRGGQALEEFDA